MIISEVLKRTTDHFRQKGIETARLDAEVLLAQALNWKRIDLYSRFEYPLNDEELTRCREVVRRRSDGEPTAYILGHKGFFKHDFVVTRDVLIPRPETECLVEKAVEKLSTQDELCVVDLGAGSGCIGLSLLMEFPKAKLVAIDICERALAVAKENAERLGVANRVEFVRGDVAEVDIPCADLIVANPPYIEIDDPRLAPEVKSFEPSLALFADNSGLEKVFSWTMRAIKQIKKDGFYFCEIGQGQEEAVRNYFDEMNFFEKVIFHKDLSGIVRFFEVNHG